MSRAIRRHQNHCLVAPSIGDNNSLCLKNRRNYSKSLIFQFATLPSGLYENPIHLVLASTRQVIHVEINKLTTIIKYRAGQNGKLKQIGEA